MTILILLLLLYCNVFIISYNTNNKIKNNININRINNNNNNKQIIINKQEINNKINQLIKLNSNNINNKQIIYLVNQLIQSNDSNIIEKLLLQLSINQPIDSLLLFLHIYQYNKPLLQSGHVAIALNSINTINKHNIKHISLFNNTLTSNYIVNYNNSIEYLPILLQIANELDIINIGLIVKALTLTTYNIKYWNTTLNIFQYSKSIVNQLNVKALPSIIYGQTILALAKAGVEQHIYSITIDMLENNIEPTNKTLDLLFIELSKHGSYNLMIQLIPLFIRYNIMITSNHRNCLLVTLDKLQLYELIYNLYNKSIMKSDYYITSNDLDIISLGILVKTCDRLKLSQSIYQIYKDYISISNRLVDLSIYERIFAILVKESTINSSTIALKLLLAYNLIDFRRRLDNEIDSNTDSTLHSKIDRYIHSKLIKQLDRLIGYESIKLDYQQQINDFLFCDLSDMFILIDQLDIQQLTNHLISINHPLDRNTSSLYLAVYTTLSNTLYLTNALKILSSYLSRGGILGESMLVSLLVGCKQCKNYQLANQLIQLVEPLDIITISSYNVLLLVYISTNQFDNYLSIILNKIKQKKLDWDIYTYTSLIIGYTSNQPDRVIELFDELIDKQMFNCLSNYQIIINVLTSCLTINYYEKSIDIFNLIYLSNTQSNHLANYPFTTFSKSIITKYLSNLSNYKKAIQIDSNIALCVLQVLRNNNNKIDSLEIVSKIRLLSIDLSDSCYDCLLSILDNTNDWENAVKILLQMLRKGKQISPKSLNLVLSICSRTNQWEMIVKICRQAPLLFKDLKMLPSTMSLAITASCKMNDIDTAIKILNEMVSQEIHPSMASIAQVMTCLESLGRFEESSLLFETLIACHLTSQEGTSISSELVLDLHGYSTAVARACIRSALNLLKKEALSNSKKSSNSLSNHLNNTILDKKIIRSKSRKEYKLDQSTNIYQSIYLSNLANTSSVVRNLVIITGIGKNSKEWLEPVLRPSIQTWLRYDFTPELIAYTILDNPGRLIVTGDNILMWSLAQ